MTSEIKHKPLKCKLGFHHWEEWFDHNGKCNRGCPNCGKVQMYWGMALISECWFDWAEGWTYKQAVAMSNAYKRNASTDELLQIMRENKV